MNWAKWMEQVGAAYAVLGQTQYHPNDAYREDLDQTQEDSHVRWVVRAHEDVDDHT